MHLEPLGAEAFDAFARRSIDGFAGSQVAAGLSGRPEAVRQAQRAFTDLLPDRQDTTGHLIWTVHAETGPAVGYVWLGVREVRGRLEAYVYDLDIDVSARGRRLGRAAMLAAEDAARRRGASVVRLTVFAHAAPALRLYDSLGYVVEGALLTRRLDVPPPADPGPRVALRDMTSEQFAGLRDALRHRGVEVDGLLPDGPATMGHRLWTAYDGSGPVACAWVELQHRPDRIHAHVRHLEVAHELRRRGYGRAALLAMTDECRRLGATSAGLWVVAGDEPAWATGDVSGFVLTAQTRVKAL